MKKKNVTIQDIAKELNLSASTVSRSLNDNPAISRVTKERVMETAHRLGYSQGVMLTEISRVKNKLIAVLVPNIEFPFYQQIVTEIDCVATHNNYSVSVYLTNNSYEREKYISETLRSQNISGMLVSQAIDTRDTSHLQYYVDENIPVIQFNRIDYDFPSTKVVTDSYMDVYKATEHLISMGCKKIALTSKHYDCSLFSEKIKAYKAALQKHGISFNENYVTYSELTEEDIAESLKIFYSQPEKPDGLILPNNISVLMAYNYLKNLQLSVPEDVAVICLFDEPHNALMNPSISAVNQSSYAMGQVITEKLIKRIEGNGAKNITELIVNPPKLIIRNSSLRR